MVLLLSRMSREEYSRWVEKVSQGFSKGEVVELTSRHVRDIMMATKGNVAVATPRHLFILVNLPWQPLQNLFDIVGSRYQGRLKDVKIVCRVIKSYPERKFSLCEARVFELIYDYTRGYEDFIVERENERVEVEGAEFIVSEGVRRRFQENGEVVISWDGGEYRLTTRVSERAKIGESREQSIVWRIIDASKPLGRFLAKNQELLRIKPSSVYSTMLVFTNDIVVKVNARSSGIDVKLWRINLPGDEELLECSRFYTIILPRIVIFDYNGDFAKTTVIADLYYKGYKRRLVFNYIPEKLLFRCLRMRYSISSYAKRVLPRGVPYLSVSLEFFRDGYVEELRKWARMIREEVLPKVRSLHSEPRKLEPLETFLEVFYVNTPKRKVENVVKPWIMLYEKVKDLAPKTTLYITFYGLYRRRPNYVGLKIEKDGTITVMSNRYVPISGIVMKGGEFEKLYRETYVKKLFEYQIVPRDEKLRILAEDVEEARRMLREAGVEPTTVSLQEFESKLKEVARNYEGDNIVLLTLKFLETIGKPQLKIDVDALTKMLVGLVKTGRYPEDYRRFAEMGGLRLVRTVVKYEMKRRGYSMRKGVMFLGDPEAVRRRILEAVKGIKGRLLALFEEIGTSEAIGEVGIAYSLERVSALLEF